MIIIFLSIVLIAPIFAFQIYKHQGKRQLVKLDLVQFIYLFVMSPVLFVWVKSFLYFLLKGDLGNSLSFTEVFIVDTVLSVICFYIFSAVAIHTLTKTFRLQKEHNPLFDMFELSEYFHLWWSHLIIWIGLQMLLVFISLVNVIMPLTIVPHAFSAFWPLAVGTFLGASLYLGMIIRTYLDSEELQANYVRIMKLCFAFFFLLHVIVYFLVDPTFSAQYAVFWTVLMTFFTTVLCSLLLRYSRIRRWIRMYLLLFQSSRIKVLQLMRRTISRNSY